MINLKIRFVARVLFACAFFTFGSLTESFAYESEWNGAINGSTDSVLQKIEESPVLENGKTVSVSFQGDGNGGSPNAFSLVKVNLTKASLVTFRATARYSGYQTPATGDDWVLYDNIISEPLYPYAQSDSLWVQDFRRLWNGEISSAYVSFYLNKGTYYFGIHSTKDGQRGTADISFEVNDTYEESYEETQYKLLESKKDAIPLSVGQTVNGFITGIVQHDGYYDHNGMKDTSDWYKLTIKTSDRYSVQASLKFEISDDSGDPPKTLAKDAVYYLNPGTYYIRLYGVDAGGYKLTVAKETRHIVSMYEVKGSYPKYAYVKDGDTVPEPPDPILHDGSFFHGWFLDVNYEYPYDFSSPVTNDLKLYAKWTMEPRLYAVAFESNGGNEVEHQMIARGGKPDRPADPTRNGYAFKGWYSDSKLTKVFDFNAPVKSDVTAYAKWEKLPSVFTVAFDANGGSAVAEQKVGEGKAVAKPADPTRSGYSFKGWFSDKALIKAYDFSAAVKSDITLYAKWEKAAPKPRPSAQFTDVTGTSTWVINQGYLDYAVEKGLMTGYRDPATGKPNGKFGPEDTLTRGQVAVVLFRIANPGKDASGGTTGFSDQGAFPYYRGAIKWLKDQGLATGDRDPVTQRPLNTFRPDANITRQELATLVYRFARYRGADPGRVDAGSISKFKDGRDVMPFAREAVAWCNSAKVITGGQGADAGKLMPLDNATRAQAAKIFSALHRDVLGLGE